jgi:hypothetical protein
VQEPDLDGAILAIKSSYARRKKHHHHGDLPEVQEDETNDPVLPPVEEDNFATNLNWATTENPDGVAVVHDPIDHVRSCIIHCSQ